MSRICNPRSLFQKKALLIFISLSKFNKNKRGLLLLVFSHGLQIRDIGVEIKIELLHFFFGK